MERVAVITGGNGCGSARCALSSDFASLFCSGIGFALAQRLLAEGAGEGERVRVCLACRNLEKAEIARRSLLADNPGCEVDVVHIDVSSVASVKAACEEIERRYLCRGAIT